MAPVPKNADFGAAHGLYAGEIDLYRIFYVPTPPAPYLPAHGRAGRRVRTPIYLSLRYFVRLLSFFYHLLRPDRAVLIPTVEFYSARLIRPISPHSDNHFSSTTQVFVNMVRAMVVTVVLWIERNFIYMHRSVFGNSERAYIAVCKSCILINLLFNTDIN